MTVVCVFFFYIKRVYTVCVLFIWVGGWVWKLQQSDNRLVLSDLEVRRDNVSSLSLSLEILLPTS
jgi:hypothetical protein